MECTRWSIFNGVHLVEYTRVSTLGGKHLVEHTWWNTVPLMSVQTLPVTAACLYEQNSAYVTRYQALFERFKILPAGNLRVKKPIFS